jgi:hypothetical protein
MDNQRFSVKEIKRNKVLSNKGIKDYMDAALISIGFKYYLVTATFPLDQGRINNIIAKECDENTYFGVDCIWDIGTHTQMIRVSDEFSQESSLDTLRSILKKLLADYIKFLEENEVAKSFKNKKTTVH